MRDGALVDRGVGRGVRGRRRRRGERTPGDARRRPPDVPRPVRRERLPQALPQFDTQDRYREGDRWIEG